MGAYGGESCPISKMGSKKSYGLLADIISHALNQIIQVVGIIIHHTTY